MDETSLRAELERVLADEPPLGALVGSSLRAGRKLRRRRRAGVAALCAAAVAVVIAVPALLSGASRPGPSAASARPAVARTAYVAVGGDTVVPISLGTNAVGTPINAPVTGMAGGTGTTRAAATPDGRTVYELGISAAGEPVVTPIETETSTAGPTITLPHVNPLDIAIDPNGKTAYVSFDGGVVPINLARNTAGKLLRIPTRCWAMAFTPDGRTLYVTNPFGGPGPGSHSAYSTPTVTPILTASNTALAPIKLRLPEHSSGYLFDIAITPDGKTAYVVDGAGGGPYVSSVIPIDVATNRALAPIRIKARGMAQRIVMGPGGRTAYVLSVGAVTPIDTASNKAGPAINLPASVGSANGIALTPNGKTLYVISPRGVIPIRTASRTVLPMITVPGLMAFTDLYITPDGRTVYVDTSTGVVPISTTANTAGKVINLGVGPRSCLVGSCRQAPSAITFAR